MQCGNSDRVFAGFQAVEPARHTVATSCQHKNWQACFRTFLSLQFDSPHWKLITRIMGDTTAYRVITNVGKKPGFRPGGGRLGVRNCEGSW